MTEYQPYSFATNCQAFSKLQAESINSLAKLSQNKESLITIFNKISEQMSSVYKVNLKVDLSSANYIKKDYLTKFLSADDIIIHFFHTNSQEDIFLVFNSSLARTLLAQLLSTSMLDNTPILPLSPTEKGLLAYITARMLLDLKNDNESLLPKLKIMGIYHLHDEDFTQLNNKNDGALNLDITAENQKYDATLMLNTQLLNNFNNSLFNYKQTIHRFSYLNYPFHIVIKRLKISIKDLFALELGDLIMFNEKSLSLKNKNELSGKIHVYWNALSTESSIYAEQGQYHLIIDKAFGLGKEEQMEQVISNDDSLLENEVAKFSNLASNLQVSLSIELGKMSMSLQQISDLHEGSIIDLAKNTDEPLDLVLQGKTIGKCLPVQLEGRLGIRILSVDKNG